MTLLTDIDKKPMQGYVLQHGIERIRLKVPLAEARAFEAELTQAIAAGSFSKAELLKIVHDHGGAERSK